MLVTILHKNGKYYYRPVGLRNLRIKPLTAYSGTYWNLKNVRYYDKAGNLLTVSNVTKININKATFNLGGVLTTVELKGTVLSGSYDISYLFTNTSNGMISTGVGGDNGLYYTFEKPISLGKIVSSTHVNAGYNMKDFQVLGNDETRILYEGTAPNKGNDTITMILK